VAVLTVTPRHSSNSGTTHAVHSSEQTVQSAWRDTKCTGTVPCSPNCGTHFYTQGAPARPHPLPVTICCMVPRNWCMGCMCAQTNMATASSHGLKLRFGNHTGGLYGAALMYRGHVSWWEHALCLPRALAAAAPRPRLQGLATLADQACVGPDFGHLSLLPLITLIITACIYSTCKAGGMVSVGGRGSPC
jgi:hypothetical protein